MRAIAFVLLSFCAVAASGPSWAARSRYGVDDRVRAEDVEQVVKEFEELLKANNRVVLPVPTTDPATMAGSIIFYSNGGVAGPGPGGFYYQPVSPDKPEVKQVGESWALRVVGFKTSANVGILTFVKANVALDELVKVELSELVRVHAPNLNAKAAYDVMRVINFDPNRLQYCHSISIWRLRREVYRKLDTSAAISGFVFASGGAAYAYDQSRTATREFVAGDCPPINWKEVQDQAARSMTAPLDTTTWQNKGVSVTASEEGRAEQVLVSGTAPVKLEDALASNPALFGRAVAAQKFLKMEQGG